MTSYEIIKPSAVIEEHSPDPLKSIERATRTCYRSEGMIEPGSAEKLVRKLIKFWHDAMLEHAWMSVRFTVDRGVSHELVRHRLAAYAQESTRYCDYSAERHGGKVRVIEPTGWPVVDKMYVWQEAVETACDAYQAAREAGIPAEIARDLLPTCTATQIVVTANMREWRHVFTLRTSPAAHPRMREVMIPLLAECKSRWPALFEDIEAKP